ncbi:MAG: hypothetical protein GX131_17800 [candidate division WS1 bacterium]|jgi:hypothetical protein|nr:hypothetical protein [candidate division WS1 bacterium]
MYRSSRHTIALCLSLTAVLVLNTGCARAQVSPDLRELGRELDMLDAEIILLEDLNTLQLSAEQIGLLIPAVERLRATSMGVEQQRIALLRQFRPLLQQRRDLLIRDQQPPDQLMDQIGDMQDALLELDITLDEALAPHAQTFREILTEPQVAIITGEEQARRQVLDLVEWVRELDDEAFEREVPPYADELAQPDLDLDSETILELLSVARAMDAQQYQRGGEEIRGRLIELFRPSFESADRIIVQVFLHDAMPRVLADKLRFVTEGAG